MKIWGFSLFSYERAEIFYDRGKIMKENYYRPSGKFTVPAILILLLGVALTGTILAIPYLLLIRVCPFVYLNILFAVLYGLAVGFVGSLICKYLKIRNIPVACIMMGIGNLIFTYFKWAFFVSYNFSPFFQEKESYTALIPDIITDPVSFWECIEIINEFGTWGMSSRHGAEIDSNVTGVFLALIWIAEIIVIAACAYTIMMGRLKAPFIEEEDSWAEKDDKEYQFDFSLEAEKPSILMNPDSILSYPKRLAANPTAPYVNMKLYHSQDFRECYYELTEMRYNQKNKKHESKSGVSCLKTSPMFYENLRNKFLNIAPSPFETNEPAEAGAPDKNYSFSEAIFNRNSSAEESYQVL